MHKIFETFNVWKSFKRLMNENLQNVEFIKNLLNVSSNQIYKMFDAKISING